MRDVSVARSASSPFETQTKRRAGAGRSSDRSGQGGAQQRGACLRRKRCDASLRLRRKRLRRSAHPGRQHLQQQRLRPQSSFDVAIESSERPSGKHLVARTLDDQLEGRETQQLLLDLGVAARHAMVRGEEAQDVGLELETAETDGAEARGRGRHHEHGDGVAAQEVAGAGGAGNGVQRRCSRGWGITAGESDSNAGTSVKVSAKEKTTPMAVKTPMSRIGEIWEAPSAAKPAAVVMALSRQGLQVASIDSRHQTRRDGPISRVGGVGMDAEVAREQMRGLGRGDDGQDGRHHHDHQIERATGERHEAEAPGARGDGRQQHGAHRARRAGGVVEDPAHGEEHQRGEPAQRAGRPGIEVVGDDIRARELERAHAIAGLRQLLLDARHETLRCCGPRPRARNSAIAT